MKKEDKMRASSNQIVVEVVHSKDCGGHFQEESRIVPLVCEEEARSIAYGLGGTIRLLQKPLLHLPCPGGVL